MSMNYIYIQYCELSKGRQTWSFILKKNIPAPNALEETVNFLEKNLQRKIGRTLIDYNQAVLDIFELENTTWEYEQTVNKRILDPDDCDEDNIEKLTRKVRFTKIGLFTREYLWNQMRKLSTMWKHLERGRLRRRTIATASMLLRGFVKIVEDGARILLQNIDSSGTPIGGEGERSWQSWLANS